MRAVVVKQHGGPDVLEVTDQDVPRVAPGQLVVAVEAAGINFIDIYQRQGNPPYATSLPYVPGLEGAGTVVAVGPDVTGVAEGDTVAWTGSPGSYAEQVAIPADQAVPVPDGIGTQLAAAVMLQGMTAHYLATSTYPITEGDTAVVHAAAGGVGLLLTQLVTMRGGIVVATTSTAAKAELARQAGAAHVTDYADVPTVVRDVTDGAGAAVVYDGVGRTTFDTGLTLLRPRGYMVLYGAASGPVPPLELQRLSGGGSLFVTRPTLAHYTADRDELLRRANDLFSWIQQGRLTVRIGGTYPLDDASRAHDDLASRRTTGKLLLTPR
jgi:NADPH2:quinone reductase